MIGRWNPVASFLRPAQADPGERCAHSCLTIQREGSETRPRKRIALVRLSLIRKRNG